ncbi:MAG: FAD-dependent oxidoreductase [Phycisphaerae bacterium]|nr:FAD-dependent oxidoreductase [Phycisphaerae bacterium]
MKLIRAVVLQVLLASSFEARGAAARHDLVIYGGTSAGIIAAVQARRMGRSVVIVGPDRHLGGLSSGGLGWTDSGKKHVIGGLAREFYRRIKAHYDRPEAWRQQKPSAYSRYRSNDDAMWVFEPHVAEKIFEHLVKEYGIRVHRDQWLDRKSGVKLQNGRIQSIKMLSGETYAGRMFIDATYEGDLMAAAGIAFHVGRESNAAYGETMNGVQTRLARSHQFRKRIDPYVIPGDPSSGLLPRVHDQGPGDEGAGDHRVQAYNYRLCLTNDASNRVPFPKPAGYDAAQYELLARSLQAGSRHVFGKFDPAPNHKTDTNNHGAFSTDNIGMNYDYPEASYRRRREILLEHETYQKGYFYFLCHDPRVPEEVRSRMSKWGLAKDEFLDNGHWPHQIYVREARRMVSDFVTTERHLRRQEPTPRPIGMGSYNMDSHNVQRYVVRDGEGRAYVRNEGDIQVNPGGPYPISYGAVVPRKSQCTNLLVPVCVSSSHIAYGSIRMEPVFMILGQSAATAAVQALEQDIAVQDVAYDRLRERLREDGQVLEDSGSRAPSKRGIDPKTLAGVIVDDSMARFIGAWAASRSVTPFVGAGYHHDQNAGQGKKSARFEARLPETGLYDVRLGYSANPNRATSVSVEIRHADGLDEVKLNQRVAPKFDGVFSSLGKFRFDAARPAVVTVENKGADGYVVIDAVQFLPTR